MSSGFVSPGSSAHRSSRFALVSVVAALALGCSSDDDDPGTGPGTQAPPQQVTITMSDFAFSPRVDTVAVGGTVTWVNNGPSPHTSTSAAGGWDSGVVPDGQSFPQVFATAGSFGYICSLHPQMTGTIVAR